MICWRVGRRAGADALSLRTSCSSVGRVGGEEGEQPDRLGPAPVDSASQRQQGTKTRAQTRENNFWHTLSSADDGFEIKVDLSIDIIRNSSNDSQFLSPNAPLSILCFLCIAFIVHKHHNPSIPDAILKYRLSTIIEGDVCVYCRRWGVFTRKINTLYTVY